MAYEYNRSIQDAAFRCEKALPAAGASATTEAFDFEHRSPGEMDGVEAAILLPALPNLAATKAVTVTLEHSADGVTFTPTDPAITTKVVGVAAGEGVEAGGAEKEVRFRFPPLTHRYVRLAIAVEASGGNNTAKEITFALLF